MFCSNIPQAQLIVRMWVKRSYRYTLWGISNDTAYCCKAHRDRPQVTVRNTSAVQINTKIMKTHSLLKKKKKTRLLLGHVTALLLNSHLWQGAMGFKGVHSSSTWSEKNWLHLITHHRLRPIMTLFSRAAFTQTSEQLNTFSQSSLHHCQRETLEKNLPCSLTPVTDKQFSRILDKRIKF